MQSDFCRRKAKGGKKHAMHSEAMQSAHTNICPVCGIKFVRTCSVQAWGYAYDNTLVCSYKCMREFERRDREQEEKAVKGTRQERLQLTSMIASLYREGMDVYDIAGQLNKSTSTIYNALKRSGVKLRTAKTMKEEPKEMEPEEKIQEETAAAEEDLRAKVERITKQSEELRREAERLEKQLAEQKALADAAAGLMILWKEKYELAERNRSIIEDMSRKEAAYFEALRAARGMKEEA